MKAHRESIHLIETANLQSDELLCFSLKQVGLLLATQRDYQGSIASLQKALTVARRSRLKVLGPAYQCSVLLCMANQAQNLKYDRAQQLVYLHEAIVAARQSGDPDLLAQALCLTALSLQPIDAHRCKSLLTEALHIVRTNPACKPVIALQIYANAGLSSFMDGKYSEAERYYQQSLAISDKLPAQKDYSLTSLGHLCAISYCQRNFEQSDRYYEKAEQFRKANGITDPASVSQLIRLHGLVLWLEGKETESAKELNRAADIKSKSGLDAHAQLNSNLNFFANSYLVDLSPLPPTLDSALKVSKAMTDVLGARSLYHAVYLKVVGDLFQRAGHSNEAAVLLARAKVARDTALKTTEVAH